MAIINMDTVIMTIIIMIMGIIMGGVLMDTDMDMDTTIVVQATSVDLAGLHHSRPATIDTLENIVHPMIHIIITMDMITGMDMDTVMGMDTDMGTGIVEAIIIKATIIIAMSHLPHRRRFHLILGFMDPLDR